MYRNKITGPLLVEADIHENVNKTILNVANENNDQICAMEILKLEIGNMFMENQFNIESV